MEEKTFYTYILRCADGTLYTGYTTNLKRRMAMHNAGKGAKYTRGRGPVELLHFEEFSSKGEALKREAQIKKLSKNRKQELIDGKWDKETCL